MLTDVIWFNLCNSPVRVCKFSRFSHVWLFLTLWTIARWAPCCHFLLQGIFLTQGPNPCLLHLLTGRWILATLAAPGKPKSPCVNSNPHPTPFPVSSKKLILSTSCFTEKRFWLASSCYDVRDRHQHDKFLSIRKAGSLILCQCEGLGVRKTEGTTLGEAYPLESSSLNFISAASKLCNPGKSHKLLWASTSLSTKLNRIRLSLGMGAVRIKWNNQCEGSGPLSAGYTISVSRYQSLLSGILFICCSL